MKLSQLSLKNYGRFDDVTLTFNKDITVIIGRNGAGKTTVLTAVANGLSWLSARILKEKGSGSKLGEGVIKNGSTNASYSLLFDGLGNKFNLEVFKTKKGRIPNGKNDFSDVTELANMYRTSLSYSETGEDNLPILAYYPVERSLIKIPLRRGAKHDFEQMEGYEHSLANAIKFERFVEWFRYREDFENEQRLRADIGYVDVQLESVRTAIYRFMPNFKNICIKRSPIRMSIDKNNESLDVAILSQGEKSLMALVGDIARRLAMLNPCHNNPLEGSGVVLIDEVDLHLHPKWQKTVIQNLRTTFPNCQFILTTHSPLVISNAQDIQVYELNNGEISKLDGLYGMDANQVLSETQGVGVRSDEVKERFDEIIRLAEQKKFEEARNSLQDLKLTVSAKNLELSRVEMLINKLELFS